MIRRGSAWGASLLLAALIPLPALADGSDPNGYYKPAQAKPQGKAIRCQHMQADLLGTGRDDKIVGTNHDDVIAARDGNDEVRGRDGKDTICAGTGRDRVTGGAGADHIFGGGGNDRIYGGPSGNDICDGGSGSHDKASSSCERVVGVP